MAKRHNKFSMIGSVKAVHTHHVVAPSILLNADIALRTLEAKCGGGHSD